MGENNEESDIENEIMVLLSIYEDQLTIFRDNSDEITNVQIDLYPATADDQHSQFVKISLDIFIRKEYPNVPLDVKFNSSRGLSDDFLKNLKSNLDKLMADLIGDSMFFEVIEFTKEKLTANNIPSCPCPICLLAFRELDDFLKTDCFHYFHSYCLYQYITHCLQNQDHGEARNKTKSKAKSNRTFCPVCRVEIALNYAELQNSPEPLLHEEPIKVDLSHWNEAKIKRDETFLRQKNRGGIIDLVAEKNKHLISEIEQAYLGSINLPSDDISGSSNEDATLRNEVITPMTSSRGSCNREDVVAKSPTVEPKHRHQFGRNYQNYRGQGRGGRRVRQNSSRNPSSDNKFSSYKNSNTNSDSKNAQNFAKSAIISKKTESHQRVLNSNKNTIYSNSNAMCDAKPYISGTPERKSQFSAKLVSPNRSKEPPLKDNVRKAPNQHNNSHRDNKNRAKQFRPRSSNFHRSPKSENGNQQPKQLDNNKMKEKRVTAE